MPLIDQDIAALGPILLSVYMLKFLCEAGGTGQRRLDRVTEVIH